MTKLIFSLTLVTIACGSSHSVPDDPTPKPTAKAVLDVSVVTSPEAAGAVNTSLIIGPTEVVIVDAQFTKSGATAVADAAEALGKRVTTVFISHAHPDHFLGTAVLKQRFPKARFVASASVVDQMNASAMAIAKARQEMLGPEFPGMPVIPTAIEELSVDGVDVEIIEDLKGDTHPIAALYLPTSGTLIASDVVYVDVHLWTATTDHDGRMAWAEQISTLEALPGLQRVIPGHQLEASEQSLDALRYTREYIQAFDAAKSAAGSSEELISAMKQAYPEAKGELFLQIGAQAAFASAH